MRGSETTTAAIVVAGGAATTRERVRRELAHRYGGDYAVVATDGAGAWAALERLARAGAEAALVLASGAEPAGRELLARVPTLFPGARRGLLVPWLGWGEPAIAGEILRAMAEGAIDYYVLEPTHTPDELFHRTVTEFLHEWARGRVGGANVVTVVGEPSARRSHELRALLATNGIPHAFVDAEPAARLPLVAFRDGPLLVDPSDAQVAERWALPTRLAERDFDVVVVGGGPAGLAAAVYSASEGLRVLVVESRAIGGQASTSSRIRNYLGFPRGVGGAELTMRAYQQAWVLGARFLLLDAVERLERRGNRLALALAASGEVTARAAVLATGVDYRWLAVPGLEALHGAGVFYGGSISEGPALAGRDVFVVGGGNSAGQAALHLARYARRVTLLVRGESLARSMSRYLVDELAAMRNVEVRFGVEIAGGDGEDRLERLELRDRRTHRVESVSAAALFVLIGAEPRTDWLGQAVARDRWGSVLTGAETGAAWHVDGRPPLPLETSLPGVFAAGDVRRGAARRVAGAVGEGSAVVGQVHEYLEHEVEQVHRAAA